MRFVKETIVSLFMVLGTSSANIAFAQSFDPYSPEGIGLTIHVNAMLWLGAEQGVVESCGGDVSVNGEKLLTFVNAAEVAKGKEYSKFLAGMFFEGMNIGFAAGCNVDKLRAYQSWAVTYYGPALLTLR